MLATPLRCPFVPSPESSRRNLEKARACWRPPRPWRSHRETEVIRRLVWQWLTYRGAGKWSGRALGRRLGVSHTYIQKLVGQFMIDPGKMQREQRTYGETTFEQLRRAQEETQQERELGYLRSPRLWKMVEFKVGDNIVRSEVPTKASVATPATRDAIPRGVPPWASETIFPKHFPTPFRLLRRRPGMRFRY